MVGSGSARMLPALRFHGNVNVFEELARRDAHNSVRRFNEIISGVAAVLSTEGVEETQRSVELFCMNQKPGAIGLPLTCVFHEFTHGGGRVGKFFETKIQYI